MDPSAQKRWPILIGSTLMNGAICIGTYGFRFQVTV